MIYLIKMLFNTTDKTYHPILYTESPLPSYTPEDKFTRFKSKGHHTIGFKEKEDALEHIQVDIMQSPALSDASFIEQYEGEVLPWDGREIPTDNQLIDIKEI